jgi:hypothetical protein
VCLGGAARQLASGMPVTKEETVQCCSAHMQCLHGPVLAGTAAPLGRVCVVPPNCDFVPFFLHCSLVLPSTGVPDHALRADAQPQHDWGLHE